jgi:acyl-homoserine lactone acylase PvdQ
MACAALFPVAALSQMHPNRELTVAEVRTALEWKIARGASYQTIWNTGYDFFRVHLRNQDTAEAIYRAFLAVRGNTDEQQKAITQAAIYWQKIHDYGITNVPVGIDNSLRDTVPSPRRGREGTLRMARPKGGPVPMRDSEATVGRRAEPRRRLNGRLDNPWPGKYYSGVYPDYLPPDRVREREKARERGQRR